MLRSRVGALMRIFWGLNPLSQKGPVADLETVACEGTLSEKSTTLS